MPSTGTATRPRGGQGGGTAVEDGLALTPPKRLPPYHVVLLDDNAHTYRYVIEMLKNLFGHTDEMAYGLVKKVDLEGRAIVDTTTKERAELKRDQIHAYGADGSVKGCAGSMSSVIEPALES